MVIRLACGAASTVSLDGIDRYCFRIDRCSIRFGPVTIERVFQISGRHRDRPKKREDDVYA
jgi:hypothetical protein